MHFSYGLNEYLETFGKCGIVFIVPLLVAHAEEFEIEWFGVSHICTQFCPFVCCWVAICKVDEVYAVVYVWLQLVEWHMHFILVFDIILELAAHAHVEHWQGFGANLFRQQEILVESESV